MLLSRFCHTFLLWSQSGHQEACKAPFLPRLSWNNGTYLLQVSFTLFPVAPPLMGHSHGHKCRIFFFSWYPDRAAAFPSSTTPCPTQLFPSSLPPSYTLRRERSGERRALPAHRGPCSSSPPVGPRGMEDNLAEATTCRGNTPAKVSLTGTIASFPLIQRGTEEPPEALVSRTPQSQASQDALLCGGRGKGFKCPHGSHFTDG